MKSIKHLAASLTLIALVFSGCQKETFTGIDTSKPQVTDFTCVDAAYSGKTVVMGWNAEKAVAAGAVSFTLQLVEDKDGLHPDNYNSSLSTTIQAEKDVVAYTGKISGQTKGNCYYVRVRVNYKKSIYSDWTWLTYENGEPALFKLGRGIITEGIEDPYMYKVTPTSTGIIVKWDAISYATGYVLEYKKTSDSEWTILELGTAETICKIKGLPSETEYEVRMCTITENGNSEYCETQTVSTRQPGSFKKEMGTAEELVNWLESGVVEVESSETYSITADIDLSGIEYTAMDEPLLGTFSGNGHTITGAGAPLFFQNEGTIKDLTVKGEINITSEAPEAGSFITTNKGILKNVKVAINQNFSTNSDVDVFIGGIACYNEGTIEDCVNDGNITVKQKAVSTKSICVGGIVSAATESTSKLINCTNNGNVSYTNDGDGNCNIGTAIAGIAGYVQGLVKDCTNEGAVSQQIPWSTATAGKGFLPFLDGKVSTTATYGTPATGGIAAYSYAEDPSAALLDGCINNGPVTFTVTSIDKYTTTVQRVQAAGIIANPYGLIKDCINNGKCVFAANTTTGAASTGTYLMCCGGIGGGDWFPASQAATNYQNCVNNGDIEYTKFDKVGSSNSTCGGICGWPGLEGSRTNKTSNCVNNGNIIFSGTGKARIGGIHGGSGAMEGCINNGKVHCMSGDENSAIGGLAGFSSNGLTFSKCESRGPVVSDIAIAYGVGGAIGNLGNSANSGKLTNCIVATKVVNGEADNAHTGMIIGYFNGTSASTPLGASGAIKVSGKISIGGKVTAITAGNMEGFLAGTANASATAHPITAVFDTTPYVDPDDNGEGGDETSLDAPSNVSVAIAYNAVTVKWDAVDGAEWYVVEWKKRADSAWTVGKKTEECQYSIEGLEHGTEYSFRVKAFTTTGSGYSNEVNEETLEEVNLDKPVVTLAAEPTTITATWAAISGAKAYALQYKLSADAEWGAAVQTAETSYTITSLKAETAYDVRVKALGEGGNEGDYCDAVSITTDKITITYPYTINTADEFVQWLALAETCVATDEVILGANINLSGKTVTPAPSFAGILNGNGKSINLAGTEAHGMFATIAGTVKDLTITGSVKVSLTEAAEMFFGVLADRSTAVLSNVTNSAAVTVATTSTLSCPIVAGVVGYQKGGSLTNVKNTAAISVTHAGTTSAKKSGISVNTFCEIAGVVGLLESSVADGCENTGAITVKTTDNKAVGARHYIGGIIATPQAATIQNCINRGNVSADFSEGGVAGSNGKQVWVGGIAGGRNSDVKNADGADIINCQNYGDLSLDIDNTSNHYLAGIAGQAHCEAASGITSGETYGLRKIKGCTNYGKLTKKGVGACRMGGISGGAATIENSVNEGELVVENIAPAGAVGGLVGYPTQDGHPVTGSRNVGNLTAKCDVAFAMGGLFGQGGNTNQNYAGCSVNCKIEAPASTLCGIILGTAKTLSAKTINYGTAEAPFKVKGTVKGTELTADNFTSFLASDGAPVDGLITSAAGGTINVANVQFGE